MKTFLEVASWLDGARRRFPDPATPVTQAFFRFRSPLAEDPQDPSEDLVFKAGPLPGEISLWILPGAPPVTVTVADSIIIDSGELQAFAIDRIHEGLWALRPSLNLPGIIHIFVILYDVPRQPPWESSVVL